MTMYDIAFTLLFFLIIGVICFACFFLLIDSFWGDHVRSKRDVYRAKAMLMPFQKVMSTVASAPPKQFLLGGLYFLNPKWEEYHEICDYAREHGVYNDTVAKLHLKMQKLEAEEVAKFREEIRSLGPEDQEFYGLRVNSREIRGK